MLRIRHFILLPMIAASTCLCIGCGVQFKGSQGSVRTTGYSLEQSHRVDQDLERNRKDQPLQYHDNEASLRRSEYERDFYEDHYRRVHENNPANHPRDNGTSDNPFME